MRKTKLTIFLAIISLALFGVAEVASAAPIVTGVTGDLNNGASVAVEGSGFGTMDGTIVTWDNFESQTTDAQILGKSPIIGTNYTTTITNNAGATFSTARAHGGARTAKIDWPLSGARIASFGWSNQGPFSQLYITYWRYLQTTEDPLLTTTNHKQYYLFGNESSQGNGMPQGMPLIPQGNQEWGYYNNNSTFQGGWSGTNNINTIGKNWSNTVNQWNRWEFWQKLNTDYACTIGINCDGELAYWIDATLAHTRSDYKHRFVNGEYKDFGLGNMHGVTSIPAYGYFDDLYIATTKARIEIGNASTWVANTHREIQIPSAWSDSSVTVTINQGSFDALEGKYLYVIDADGNVNANGYLLTTADTTAPSAPQGLVVN